MKLIGLLGGVSWESSREYYRMLNEAARAGQGGLHSAPLLMHSFDFAEIAALQKAGEWDRLNEIMASTAKQLEKAGVEAIAICSNYMHRCADAVSEACNVPLIHIADAIGHAILAKGQKKVGLLGAAGTMELPFYRDRLAKMGIEVVIPNDEERVEINRVIFEGLCQGRFTETARANYLNVMKRLALEDGAEGMILGCTEIEQLIKPEDTDITLYPSAELHAASIAAFMLELQNTGEKAA